MVKVCESNTSFRLCVRLSDHLSVMLPPKLRGGIQPNLLHHFPLWYGCVRVTWHYFPCVRPSVCPSICPSWYLLLNHWAEFNQTCYMISPYGKGVREQARPSVSHAIPTSVGICVGRHRLRILVIIIIIITIIIAVHCHLYCKRYRYCNNLNGFQKQKLKVI